MVCLPSVLDLEVLIVELAAVDGLTARAGTVREVTALEHEVGDDTVELGALVVQRLAHLAHTLLARAERAEVFRRAGHGVAVHTHDNTTGGSTVDLNVEEDLAGDLCQLLFLGVDTVEGEKSHGKDNEQSKDLHNES